MSSIPLKLFFPDSNVAFWILSNRRPHTARVKPFGSFLFFSLKNVLLISRRRSLQHCFRCYFCVNRVNWTSNLISIAPSPQNNIIRHVIIIITIIIVIIAKQMGRICRRMGSPEHLPYACDTFEFRVLRNRRVRTLASFSRLPRPEQTALNIGKHIYPPRLRLLFYRRRGDNNDNRR